MVALGRVADVFVPAQAPTAQPALLVQRGRPDSGLAATRAVVGEPCFAASSSASAVLRIGVVTVAAARLVGGRRGRFRHCRPNRGHGRCNVASSGLARRCSTEEHTAAFQVGDTVEVIGEGIRLFNCPSSRGRPFDPSGLVGTVKSVEKDEHLTLNRPILVKLTQDAHGAQIKPFNAHFEPEEIRQKVEQEDSAAATTLESDVVAMGATAAGRKCPTKTAAIGASTATFRSRGATTRRSPAILQALMQSEVDFDSDVDSDRWIINLLYDGDCPTCMKQVEFLSKRMDENPEYKGLVRFTDLTDPGYDAAKCGGVVFEDGMLHIHAVTRDGKVISGVEVFQEVYKAVGMEWVYTITRLPFLGQFFDWLYDWYATNRLQLDGRQDVVDRISRHQAKIKELSNMDCNVECEIDWDTGEPITR